MSKSKSKSGLKAEMRARLSAEPESLNLDYRTDEAPEDLFVQRANRGEHADVVRALNALLLEQILLPSEGDADSALRFLRSGIRLCDILAAEECKGILKQVLLLDQGAIWGDDLVEFQELAARALVSLPQRKSDLRFWTSVAERLDAGFPYALNAIIEIDLREGLRLLVDTYRSTPETERDELADWATVLQIASELHGADAMAGIFDDLFSDIPDPLRRLGTFNYFAKLAKLPHSKRRRHVTIEEVLVYGQEAPTAVALSLKSARASERLSLYEQHPSNESTTIISTDLPGKPPDLYSQQTLVIHMSDDAELSTEPWKNYHSPNLRA